MIEGGNMPFRHERSFCVYILSSARGVLYVGVTSDLHRRWGEHQSDSIKGFTARYRVHRLVYFEEAHDVRVALEREKQIKAWRRAKKLALIRQSNPRFEDLEERMGLR